MLGFFWRQKDDFPMDLGPLISTYYSGRPPLPPIDPYVLCGVDGPLRILQSMSMNVKLSLKHLGFGLYF